MFLLLGCLFTNLSSLLFINIGWIHNALDVAVLGPDVDLSYDFEHLGDSPDALEKLANGSHPFAKKLASAKKPAIIVGSEVLQRPDGAALMMGDNSSIVLNCTMLSSVLKKAQCCGLSLCLGSHCSRNCEILSHSQ